MEEDRTPILLLESEDSKANVFWGIKSSINRKLIPLKMTLFIYYGAGSYVSSFLTVLLKERGISLSQMSMISIVAPAFQLMGTALSGIVTDKIGKVKPVFLFNLLVFTLSMLSIILLPPLKTAGTLHTNLTCSEEGDVIAWTSPMEVAEEAIQFNSCQGHCYTDQCKNGCEVPELESNASFKIKHESHKYIVSFINSTSIWCSTDIYQHCYLSCASNVTYELPDGDTMFLAYLVLNVIYMVSYSNTYRCLDVTCRFLVEEHGSSYGHERFFAMLGNLIVSPIAGYVAYVTAPPGKDRNYGAALYMTMILSAFVLPFVYKLPMKAKQPERNVWKKALVLSKSMDAWSFLVVLIVLGTCNNFFKYFSSWYLEGLHASSLLLGLIISISALYGLPFLLCSHFIIRKIGATRIFILAMLGYAINGIGYSLILNPWYALVLESTSILTYYLLWVATVDYSHDLAPEGLKASFITVVGAIHFSIGKVPSGLIGKYVMYPYGGKTAFIFVSICCVAFSILYSSYLIIREKFRQREVMKNTCLNGQSYEKLSIEDEELPVHVHNLKRQKSI